MTMIPEAGFTPVNEYLYLAANPAHNVSFGVYDLIGMSLLVE